MKVEMENRPWTTTAKVMPPDGEEGGLQIRQLLDLVLAGRWTVLLITLGVLLIGGLVCLLLPPVYKADALVQVEDSAKSGSMSDIGQISSLLLGTPVETEAEIQILQSRLVLQPVLDKLNLRIQVYPRYFPGIGHAISHARQGLTTPADALWGFRRFAWGGESIELPSLEVPDRWLNEQLTVTATKDGYILSGPDGDILTGKIGEKATSADGQTSILVTRLVAQPDTEFRLRKLSLQDALKNINDSLDVAEEGKQSGIIQLTLKGNSPTLAANIVNNIASSYLQQNVERRSADAQQSLDFLNNQLPDLKAKLDTAQARLAAYEKEHGTPDVSGETGVLLQQNVALETSRLETMQQRDEALQRFKPGHPVVQALNQQLSSVNAEIEKLRARTGTLPVAQQNVLSMMRDLDVDTQLYMTMLNSVQELQVAKAGTIGNVRIVDHAIAPFKPVFPKISVVLPISLLLGFFLSVAILFVQRALIKGMDDPAEIESQFGLTTYAAIPYSPEQRQIGTAMSRDEAGEYILAIRDNQNLAVESLRSLRTSLHFALLEASNNVIMLTGPSPGLGKSFIAINLGAVLAMTGKRVVVIDADLRKGHLHRFTRAPLTPGLSDHIAGDVDVAGVLRETSVKGLSFISRGTLPPNPAEILLHERLDALLKDLSQRFDYVLVDTPPILAVTDAAIVGRLAGTTMLVLKSAEHPIREIEESIRRLTNAGVTVRGVLLNQVGVRPGSYGYGGYGYTYYRYSDK
jgi:tyrosine-protein kinase Etk/Wzc